MFVLERIKPRYNKPTQKAEGPGQGRRVVGGKRKSINTFSGTQIKSLDVLSRGINLQKPKSKGRVKMEPLEHVPRIQQP
jgi:hypothetical protein